MYRHVLRNSLIPVITIFGMTAADILGGSIIVENAFFHARNRKADICLNFKQRFAAVAGTDLLLSAHCCGVQFRRRSDLFTGRSENSSEVK